MSSFCGCLATCWQGRKRMRLVRDISGITEVDPDTEVTGLEVSTYTDTGNLIVTSLTYHEVAMYE